MLSKLVSLVLCVAILGYPAPLDVDPRQKKSALSVDIEIWPVPSAPATMVVTSKPRWLIIPAQTSNGQALSGDILTKELQGQLRRLGCYGGEINGLWTQSSRRAMRTFTNRVNAALSVDRPDHILLAMLQSHPDNTCNKSCPLDENPAPDGHCVPSAIAGHSIKTAALPKSESLITSWTAVETAALEDDIPQLSASKPSRPDVPAKSPPAPKTVLQRSIVVTSNRERPRSLQRYDRDQPRVSQRAEREPSRSAHRPEFARTPFQRFFRQLSPIKERDGFEPLSIGVGPQGHDGVVTETKVS
jgi:hypothetical protein